MKTYPPWRFDSEFILNIRIQYLNNYHQIALFMFIFVLILRMNTICIRIHITFRKRILFVFEFVSKPLFIPTLLFWTTTTTTQKTFLPSLLYTQPYTLPCPKRPKARPWSLASCCSVIHFTAFHFRKGIATESHFRLVLWHP